jgi:hypothetical protein
MGSREPQITVKTDKRRIRLEFEHQEKLAVAQRARLCGRRRDRSPPSRNRQGTPRRGNCGARYTLVRAEADGASVSGQLACRSCGGPLNGREGRFVLKYFLVDRPKIPARVTRGKR